jgi:hypothetical protein
MHQRPPNAPAHNPGVPAAQYRRRSLATGSPAWPMHWGCARAGTRRMARNPSATALARRSKHAMYSPSLPEPLTLPRICANGHSTSRATCSNSVASQLGKGERGQPTCSTAAPPSRSSPRSARHRAAGTELHVRVGHEVERGQPLMTVHAESPGELAYAMAYHARHARAFMLRHR